jgi:hypothetical protein
MDYLDVRQASRELVYLCLDDESGQRSRFVDLEVRLDSIGADQLLGREHRGMGRDIRDERKDGLAA